MPSKTSKPRQKHRSPSPASLWKAANAFSEVQVAELARSLAAELKKGDRVLMEGEMGVGKTTFSRALLQGLGILQPPEGSPTFAIAHEYRSSKNEVVHIDLYRLKHESEIEESGIEAYYWERDAIVISEWTSLWPSFEAAVLKPVEGRRNWRVELSFAADGSPEARDIKITRIS